MPRSPKQGTLPGMGEEPTPLAKPLEKPTPERETAPAPSADSPPVAEQDPGSGSAQIAPPPSSGALPLAGSSVWVIDANSLIFQVFHAIPEMTSPAGQPVNAVFGFVRDILTILERKKPDYLFCAFDRPEPTFRHNLYAEYKGDRAEMPADLRPQFPVIEQLLSTMGIPVLSLAGFEADDLLATVASRTTELGGSCVIVSGDKDCRQLLNDRVTIYNVRKDQVFDTVALRQEWGIRPDQVIDFQSLVGDSVDNIPGVAGIGPKGAKELLDQFDTLEGVYAGLEQISAPKKRQNLAAGQASALLSRHLVRLEPDVPIELDWNAGRCREFQPQQALPLCQELGFHRITEQLRLLVPKPATESWNSDYVTIDTQEKFASFLEELRQQKQFSFDTETTHVSPTQADVVGYAISWLQERAYYLPVRAPAGEPRLDPATTLEALRPLLEDSAIGKLGQNLKYDMLVMRRVGVELRGVAFDTMVASYLLEAGERVHNLDELAQRHLNHANIKISSLIGAGKNQKRMDEVPVEQVTQYAAEDADVALRLVPILAEKLKTTGLDTLFRDVELPLIDVLVELEHNGVRVDVERLAELSRIYGERLIELEREIHELAGHPFNIASPKQLQEVLFTELKLPVLARNKTGASTDAEVLEELAALHPLPAKILTYRQFAKLKGTYVDALPALVNPETGRVHASFHQAVAATGRLSSSDPNLQNIPIRTDAGREIRSAFLPRDPGWVFLAADYSQIELRVLAHYSEDATLCEAFARGEDIHTLVASQVYGVDPTAVTKEQRRAAKAVNFGIIYGQSAFGLAKSLSIEQAEAARFIDAYFARYPGVEQFMNGVLVECAQQGYVTTILGRRRGIQGIRPEVSRQRNLAERTAINTVIQGSAADLIKLAMIRIHRRLHELGGPARMLLQIHDELVFELPAERVDEVRSLVVDEMSQVMTLRVPLEVDVKTGRTWAETE